jgi:ketosteroid isomerase-like protein
MSYNNEELIRHAYQVAEVQDGPAFADCFTPDGTWNDMASTNVNKGHGEIAAGIADVAKTFPDIHRELHAVHVVGDIVFVELTLSATHLGPLNTPAGVIAGTGKKAAWPCLDVFRMVEGKIEKFDCYNSATVLLAQLGVLSNLEAAVAAA